MSTSASGAGGVEHVRSDRSALGLIVGASEPSDALEGERHDRELAASRVRSFFGRRVSSGLGTKREMSDENESDQTWFFALRLVDWFGSDSIKRLTRPVRLVLAKPAAARQPSRSRVLRGGEHRHRRGHRRDDSPDNYRRCRSSIGALLIDSRAWDAEALCVCSCGRKQARKALTFFAPSPQFELVSA